MKILFITDTHWRNEEPFFVAAQAMVSELVKNIAQWAITVDSFIIVHGGDVFQRSKETGRVNGLVIKFFSELSRIQNCKAIYVITGNHDIKKETGSALDCIKGTDEKIKIIEKPEVIPLWNGKFMYCLPYMVAYSFENYKTVASYSEPEFHIPFIGDKADDIAVTFSHVGDETGGEFFAQADLSFLPGIKCNGHVHKRVSDHFPGSAMITKRDEIDQPFYLRIFDNDLCSTEDLRMRSAFNYLKVDFNDDLLADFNKMELQPYGSVMVDVKGHDSEEVAAKWFDEQKTSLPIPAFLGSVYPDEKSSDSEHLVNDDGEAKEMNIREIFAEFCTEKNVADSIRNRIEAML